MGGQRGELWGVLASYGGGGGWGTVKGVHQSATGGFGGPLGDRWGSAGDTGVLWEVLGGCRGSRGGHWGAMGSTGGILGEAGVCGVPAGGMRCY